MINLHTRKCDLCSPYIEEIETYQKNMLYQWSALQADFLPSEPLGCVEINCSLIKK